MKHTLLQLDPGYPKMDEALHKHFRVIKPKGRDPESMIMDRAQEIQAIATSLTPVRRALIEALPNLEIIAVGAVGYDHIDLQAATERSIMVTNTPDVLNDDTADTAILLMLAVMRRGVEGDAFVRAGLWTKGPLPLGTALSGKKVGIVGLGRIGKAIAQRAAVFGMDISYHGRTEQPDQPYTYYDDLMSMAADVDVLILACPGGDDTHHMVNHKILSALGRRGFLINIARGSVINTEDLLIALRNKAIAGTGLDVFEHEPNVPEAFFTMDNVVLLPHIGSGTVETRTKMGQIVIGNLLAHFEGQPLLTPVS